MMNFYADEFQQIIADAKTKYPSLLGVLEVEDAVFEQPDWSALGFGDLTQIVFEVADVLGDYGDHDAMGIGCGFTTVFYDPEGRLRTLILIRRAIKDVEDMNVIKILTLLHEIGHVHDIERQINFDLASKTAWLIGAEAFANLYALDKLAERQLVKSYRVLEDYLRTSTEADGWLGVMARKVIERLSLLEQQLIQ